MSRQASEHVNLIKVSGKQGASQIMDAASPIICPRCGADMAQCFVPTNSTTRVVYASDMKRRGVYLNLGRAVVQNDAIFALAYRLRFHPAAECRSCQILTVEYGRTVKWADIRRQAELV